MYIHCASYRQLNKSYTSNHDFYINIYMYLNKVYYYTILHRPSNNVNTNYAALIEFIVFNSHVDRFMCIKRQPIYKNQYNPITRSCFLLDI